MGVEYNIIALDIGIHHFNHRKFQFIGMQNLLAQRIIIFKMLSGYQDGSISHILLLKN